MKQKICSFQYIQSRCTISTWQQLVRDRLILILIDVECWLSYDLISPHRDIYYISPIDVHVQSATPFWLLPQKIMWIVPFFSPSLCMLGVLHLYVTHSSINNAILKWRCQTKCPLSFNVYQPPFCFSTCTYVTRSSHMSKIFNFEIFTPPSGYLKMLHFDANPINIGYLVTELWAIYQHWNQYKTKEFELFLFQYLKNDICDIRFFALDHVTYRIRHGFVLFHVFPNIADMVEKQNGRRPPSPFSIYDWCTLLNSESEGIPWRRWSP